MDKYLRWRAVIPMLRLHVDDEIHKYTVYSVPYNQTGEHSFLHIVEV